MKYYNSKARQAGMTLIELTVVLLVLIGLAGLLMPYVSGFIQKTHDSTGASNIAEVNGAMERYAAQFQGYPDNLDSLINNGATGTGTQNGLYGTNGDKLMGPRCLKAVQLSSAQAMKLKMAGIDSIVAMNTAPTDATFDSASFTNDVLDTVAMSGTPTVAMLQGTMNCLASSTDPLMYSNSALRKILVLTPDINVFDYVVFGVGQNSSMMGRVMTSAPVHFAQSGAMSAKNKYNRFGVVFEVPKSNIITNKGYCTVGNNGGDSVIDTTIASSTTCITGGTSSALPATDNVITSAAWTAVTPTSKARFAGTVMLMPMIEGLQGALERHYNAASQG